MMVLVDVPIAVGVFHLVVNHLGYKRRNTIVNDVVNRWNLLMNMIDGIVTVAMSMPNDIPSSKLNLHDYLIITRCLT